MQTLTKNTIGGKEIMLNGEGFLVHAEDWDKQLAIGIAVAEGIADLTDDHWKVINFCRQTAQNGKSPTLRQITTGTGISTKTMFALFPKGPAKKVARIAGLGKPEGCV